MVCSQKDAAGNTYKFTFNTAAGTSTMTDPLFLLYNYTHNNRDLTQETDSAGNTTQSTYDANNRLLTLCLISMARAGRWSEIASARGWTPR